MFGLIVRLVYNLFRLIFSPLWLIGHAAMRPRSRWVHVRMRGRLTEIERPAPPFIDLIPPLAAARPTSIGVLRELAELVLEDPRIDGVVFDIPPLSAGWASCASLRDVLVKLRASGKRVVAYLPLGGGNRELYVASAADRVLASRQAQLSPLGLAASVTYFKGLLDKAGVSVEVHRRAEYKTAAESATHETMSDEQREQLDALLGTFDDALRSALRERPALDEAAVDALFEEAVFSGERAVELGLLDGVCYEDELPASLDAAPPGEVGKTHRLVRAPRYYAYKKARLFVPLMPPRFIAVVPIHGTITGGSGGSRGASKFATTVTSLRLARKDPRVAGVVLHISSPGGSALASDLIHREVVRLSELKPVVASFGDAAASGGYYIGAAADAIVAQGLTVTGSIGVVSMRLVSAPLLERLGMSVQTLSRAPHADMLRQTGPLDEEESAIIDREIDGFYRAFVRIVAEGRGKKEEEIEPLARGRVWSGRDAEQRGLVDRIGGLDTALDEVRRRLEGKVGEAARARLMPRLARARFLDIPPAEPPRAALVRLLGGLDPRLAEAFELTGAPDRVLYYAAGLPEIR